jgi:hypothetical protein
MDDRFSDPPLEDCDVLVVDDDFALSEAITQLLTRSGLRVRKAHNASAALSLPLSRRRASRSSTTSCPTRPAWRWPANCAPRIPGCTSS